MKSLISFELKKISGGIPRPTVVYMNPGEHLHVSQEQHIHYQGEGVFLINNHVYNMSDLPDGKKEIKVPFYMNGCHYIHWTISFEEGKLKVSSLAEDRIQP
ncbi:hypothetical protein EBR43_01425 [bacterium]|nr:hypothetical protein [bacterium]NBW56449.1 hypothetical protein [bacterium]NBX71802.1 hypothetical protein [bacterium]